MQTEPLVRELGYETLFRSKLDSSYWKDNEQGGDGILC